MRFIPQEPVLALPLKRHKNQIDLIDNPLKAFF
jgi:hypothetical protein